MELIVINYERGTHFLLSFRLRDRMTQKADEPIDRSLGREEEAKKRRRRKKGILLSEFRWGDGGFVGPGLSSDSPEREREREENNLVGRRSNSTGSHKTNSSSSIRMHIARSTRLWTGSWCRERPAAQLEPRCRGEGRNELTVNDIYAVALVK